MYLYDCTAEQMAKKNAGSRGVVKAVGRQERGSVIKCTGINGEFFEYINKRM